MQTIYVIDDTADYRFLVQQVFRRFPVPYPLRLFKDGLELINHLEPLPADGAEPGLIVLDVDMPQLNGIQTLEWLRRHPRWQDTPVIMMSNRRDATFVAASIQRGARAYIDKPTDMQRLQNVFGQLCQNWLTNSNN